MVSIANFGSMEEWETVCDHFDATLVNLVRETNVKVPHEDIRDATTRLTAHSDRCTFQGEASAPQHSHNCARCTVVAKDVERTATPACARSGSHKRRKRRTRKT